MPKNFVTIYTTFPFLFIENVQNKTERLIKVIAPIAVEMLQ